MNSLGNLSFCMYIIHPIVIISTGVNTRKTFSFRFSDIFSDFIKDVLITYCIAWTLSLTVELPFSSLWKFYVDNAFLKKRKKPADKKGKEKEGRGGESAGNGNRSEERAAKF